MDCSTLRGTGSACSKNVVYEYQVQLDRQSKRDYVRMQNRSFEAHHSVPPSITTYRQPLPQLDRIMAAKRSSHSGRLLRSSRFFSLPAPIPAPKAPPQVSPLISHSDTATTLFPTRQAITTPASSLCRGDWGLKRPLPFKTTTRTTTPAIRLVEADSAEQFTDFESASDHTRTLAKLQELHLTFSKRRDSITDSSACSVFEEELDNSDPAVEDEELPTQPVTGTAKAVKKRRRWKHRGPSLASLTESEFNQYLKEINNEYK